MEKSKPKNGTMTELIEFNEVRVSYSCKKIGVEISSSNQAFELLLSYWKNIDYEESFVVMLLNAGNRVIGLCCISVGGVSSTIADPKKIFQTALAANASAIILSHNHPSGAVRPSANDRKITEKCKEVGVFLDLPVLDHLIVTKEAYFSFADEGYL